jgi:probable HAF family extracellular repeat protein
MNPKYLVAAGLTLTMSVAAHAQTYQVTDVAPSGYNNPSINQSGAVTGTVTFDGGYRAFVFEQGSLRLLEAAGQYNKGRAINDRGDVAGECQGRRARHIKACVWTTVGQGLRGGAVVGVNGINNARQVVGASEAGYFQIHAFRYDHGAMTDLGTLGGKVSRASAINQTGLVAGYSALPTGYYHAFLHDGVTMKDLGTLPGGSSFAFALNDAGVAAGSSDADENRRRAVVFKDGEIIDLGTLGGHNSQAWGINNAGEVVGWSDTPRFLDRRAFLYRNGHMVRLDSWLDEVSGAGWTITAALGINDAGQIVAEGMHNGESRTVLLTPMH